jgi:hypothetical protein
MLSKKFGKTDSCSSRDFEEKDSRQPKEFETIDSCSARNLKKQIHVHQEILKK